MIPGVIDILNSMRISASNITARREHRKLTNSETMLVVSHHFNRVVVLHPDTSALLLRPLGSLPFVGQLKLSSLHPTPPRFPVGLLDVAGPADGVEERHTVSIEEEISPKLHELALASQQSRAANRRFGHVLYAIGQRDCPLLVLLQAADGHLVSESCRIGYASSNSGAHLVAMLRERDEGSSRPDDARENDRVRAVQHAVLMKLVPTPQRWYAHCTINAVISDTRVLSKSNHEPRRCPKTSPLRGHGEHGPPFRRRP